MDNKENDCSPALVGGKAYNLWILSHKYELNVPSWFAVTSHLFARFIQVLLYINVFLKLIVVM